MNATAFKRVATGPGGGSPSNWFNRKQPDCGTPIFDQLAAERGSEVLEFMHSRIVTDLSWPDVQEDTPEPIQTQEFTEVSNTEGATTDV